MQSTKLSLQDAMKKVGYKGTYQIIVFILFQFQFFYSNVILNSAAFLYTDPIFLCQKNGLQLQECSQKAACDEVGNNWQLIHISDSEDSARSFTYDFNLYCDRRGYKSLAQSITFVGCCLGSFIFAYLTDKIGRKLVHIITFLCLTAGYLFVSVAQSVGVLILGNFICGFGLYASNTVSLLMLSEQSIGKFRSLTTGAVLFGYCLVQPLYSIIAYNNHCNAREMVLYYTLGPAILLNIPNFFLIESPRYYLHKSHQMVVKQFNRIAKINKKEKLELAELDLSEYPEYDGHDKNHKKKEYTYLTLFKYPSLRWITINCAVLKFLMTFIIYGQNYSLENLDLSIYLGGFIAGTMNFFSCNFGILACSKLPRKTSILISGLVISICCVSQIFFKAPQDCEGFHCWEKYASLIAYTIGTGISQIFFFVAGTYFPELFPTSIRGQGVGFIRGFGIAGSILAPYFIQMFEKRDINPLIPIGVIGFFTLILIAFLKETFNQPLPENIKEEEEEEQNLENKEENDLLISLQNAEV